MVNTLSYSNGWFSDRSSATGAPASFGKTANVLVATAAMLVNQGTGAFPDDLQLLQQLRIKDALFGPSKLPIVEIAPARTAVEDIERIREVLSPGISTLADVFGVTRQTVYNWMKGERLKPEHFARLKDLAHATDLLAESGISLSGTLLKRKVINGKNMFESVRDGGSARDVAQVLIQIAQREQQQRELMNARLAGRKKLTRSADSDFPAENDG
jgi:transcriptional regulator with XRE-family HTH domain